MAGEVVDLISSSPQHEPRPSTRPRKTHIKASAATRPAPSATVDLDGLTDEFDTTGDIDGIVPQSQRPVKPRESALRQTGISGVEIWSDDFQSTGDLAEPILSESTGNGHKRRRLSPSPRLLSSPRRISKGKGLPAADEVDYSDPFASSPPPPTADIINPKSGIAPELTASRAQLRLEPKASTIPQSSDPFASSQQAVDRFVAENGGSADVDNVGDPGTRQQSSKSIPRSPTVREVSSDPFASSPAHRKSSPRRDVMDLTRDIDDNAPRNQYIGNKSKNQISSRRDSSPDPFASSPEREKHSTSKRAGIDLVSSPPPATGTANARRQQWDPISSSAPEAAVINIDSDSASANDSDDLPDLQAVMRNPTQRSRTQLLRSRSDILPKPKSKVSKAKQPARTADEKARDKARREADKEREKERKKEDRLRAKEAKGREKERAAALAEVNKMRTDKKVSTKEMIVDVPSSLNDGTKVQLDTLLQGLEVDFKIWDTSDVVFKWRRKVTSKWNEDLGHWEPIPHRIVHEKHMAVIMTAQEFVDLVLDTDRGVRSHIVSMEEKFFGNQIIYIIEGMVPWMRKNRNLRNRQFASGVRSETTSSGRRRATPQEYIDEDIIEDAMLELQVMHDVLIHHTTIPLETAQWITILTQHISTIPYKHQKSEAQGAGFCMESGQVKTGEDNKDTYVRLLQEIARVTQPIAYGVTAEFPSVTQLVNGLSEGGPTRLSDVRKTVNREGLLGDKTIGQAVSKRIHKVFTGRDEKSTDV